MSLLLLGLIVLAFALAVTTRPARDWREDLETFKRRPVVRPLPHLRVTSEFGPRQWPLNPSRTHFHDGIDFGTASGTQVFAMADGWIEFAGVTTLDCTPGRPWRWGYGIVVCINHGVWTTMYAHLQSINPRLKKGAQVLRGETIGFSGNTGCSTGPHLHLGLGWNPGRITPDDPFAGLGEGNPRLQGRLPYWVNPRLLDFIPGSTA